MRVFVTGHRGYIGVHLVKLLKEEGHQVTGCDINLFEGCSWEDFTKSDLEIFKDIRQLEPSDLDKIDCVIHLAAISNDPMGKFNPELTLNINKNGSIHLAKIAKKVGIERFLFASSCSIYGKGKNRVQDESSKLNPASVYALSKIDAEREIAKLADENFLPVFLRSSTAYGDSPMLRIDLVANNLLACAFARGDIRIMSDGTPWRPLINVEDIARAFIAFMNLAREKTHCMAVNIGSNKENYQVRDIAKKVKRLIPEAKIVYTGEIGYDPRDYRVNFDLLYSLIPDFELKYTLESGMEQLFKKFIEHHFNLDDFNGYKYVRLRTLKKRLHMLNY